MSLIKAVDVPKHMADRLRSRRIAARLSGGRPSSQSFLPRSAMAPTLAPVNCPQRKAPQPYRGPPRSLSKTHERVRGSVQQLAVNF